MCIDLLKAYTDKLVQLEDISEKKNGSTVYSLERGTAISFDLLRGENVDVFHTFLSKDSIFPLHEHVESCETFILISGKLTVICDEDGIENHHELLIGIPFYIDKKIKHLLSVKEDSWVITIIIPPDAQILK